MLIGQFGKVGVRPGVDRQLVASHVFGLDHLRARDDARADEEEGGGEGLGIKVVEEERGVGGGSVVV